MLSCKIKIASNYFNACVANKFISTIITTSLHIVCFSKNEKQLPYLVSLLVRFHMKALNSPKKGL